MANKTDIHIKKSKVGTFTAAARRRGMGVQEFASKVTANPDNYTEAIRKKAQFAKNASRFKYKNGGKVAEVEDKVYRKALSANWYDSPITSDPLAMSQGLMQMRNDPRYTISEAEKYDKVASRDTNINPKTGKKLSEEYKEAVPYADYAVEVTDNQTNGKYIYPVFSKQVMKEEMGKQGYEMKNNYMVGGLVAGAMGIVGMVGNLIGSAKKRREEKKRQLAMMEGQRMASARDEKLSGLEPQQEYAPTFACGGIKRKMELGGGVSPVEVEGGESIVLPNGEDLNVNGPSHAQGGVDMNLPNGTRIYSDKLTVPGSKETFSEANKKISSKISSYEKILDSPKATQLAKKTAKRMLDRLNKEQDGLFQIQQSVNNNSTGSPSKQFDGGGLKVDFSELGEGTSRSATGLSSMLGNIDWGKTASGAAAMAPALYNIGQGLFGKTQKFNASDFYNPNEASATNIMRNRTMNVDPMLEANRTASSVARYNVRNVARTRGELLGGYAPIAAGQARGDMAAYAAKQQAENQYKGELASTMGNFGAQRAAANLQVSDMNARSAANRRNMLGAGLGQLSQYAQIKQQGAGLKEADQMRVEALKQMFPDIWNKLLPQGE